MKSKGSYKTIGEVCELLGLVDHETGKKKTHVIRFWEKHFKEVKPSLIYKKRRYYSDKNIEVIKKTFPKNKNYDDQIEKGLILLESLNLLENGYLTEFEELKLSLSMLTKIGLVDLVNEISTELIALNAIKKMVF